jgi:hypothetical protein
MKPLDYIIITLVVTWLVCIYMAWIILTLINLILLFSAIIIRLLGPKAKNKTPTND